MLCTFRLCGTVRTCNCDFEVVKLRTHEVRIMVLGNVATMVDNLSINNKHAYICSDNMHRLEISTFQYVELLKLCTVSVVEWMVQR